MTREHKLALIVGFSLVLVLGVLISDHFSKARKQDMAEDIQPTSSRLVGANVPGVQMKDETPTGGLMPLPGMGGTGFVQPTAGHTQIAGGPLPTGTQAVTQVVPSTGPDVRPVPQNEIVMGKPAGEQAGAMQTGAMPARRPDTGALAQMDQTPVSALPSQNQVPGMPTAAPTGAAVVAPVVAIPIQRHEVKEGDTLYRIAVKYYGEGKLWEKVREYNKGRVNGDDLRVGVTLQIPPKDVLLGKPYVPPVMAPVTMPTGTPTGVPSKPATRVADADTKSFKEYVVKEGDTLSAVARKTLGSSKRWQELVDANKGSLSDPESLKVGMKLRVPAGSGGASTTR